MIECDGELLTLCLRHLRQKKNEGIYIQTPFDEGTAILPSLTSIYIDYIITRYSAIITIDIVVGVINI